MEKHTTYYNLIDAFQEKSCPICLLAKKATHKAMDDFLYESVNDPEMRRKIRKSFGFCNLHAWQLQKLGDGFGLSIIYKDLIKHLLGKTKKNNKAIILPNKPLSCPFCEDLRGHEKRYVLTFIENFNEPEVSRRYKNSFGLCIPHLVSTVRLCKDADIIREIFEIESEKLNSLKDELEEFERKHDYRFRKEAPGAEKDSWVRAIEKLIGKEGIYEKGI